jgi:predicted nucleic acid-binding protein
MKKQTKDGKMIDFFFDSYALIEILLGNPKYKDYKDYSFVFTKLNLSEIYYSFLLKNSIKAEKILETYEDNIIDFSIDIIRKAMKFRFENKKLNLSYADCIGYICALENNLKFLTGDEKFKNMANVEFVGK